MAVVEMNNDKKYTYLSDLSTGDFFVLSGDLFVIADDGRGDDYECINFSDDNCTATFDAYETKVLFVPMDKVKIIVDL